MNSWEILVESTIDSVHVDTLNKEIRIDVTCAWEGKGRQQIVATGVDDFVANEMRLSNIIDRVNRFDGDDLDRKDSDTSKRLFFLMRGKNPSSSELEWKVLQEKISCIRDGKLSLLEIEPVYGATIVILAKNFSLEPIA
jgi:hypothetical protein